MGRRNEYDDRWWGPPVGVDEPYIPPGRMRVLVAVTDPHAAEELRHALGWDGHRVVIARSRPEAVDRIVRWAEESLDVVTPGELAVVDVDLPWLAGPQLARELRERGFDTPVVLVGAGPSNRQDVLAALNLGSVILCRRDPVSVRAAVLAAREDVRRRQVEQEAADLALGLDSDL